MADYPLTGELPPVLITPWSAGACSPFIALNVTTFISGSFVAANRALFAPFDLAAPFLAQKLFLHNGTAVSGNVDLGIYDEHGTRLLSAGSTAQAGTSVLQALDIADATVIGPGRFYLAIAADNITATVFRTVPNLNLLKSMGCAQQASAFPLPTTATFAVVASAFLPLFGVAGRSLVV